LGYNLYIGNGVVRACMEERRAWVAVDSAEHPDAPVNSLDETGNYCYPSYTQWTEFSRRHDLYMLFYAGSRGVDRPGWFRGASGKDYAGLVAQHPGAAVLTEDHYKAFAAARARFDPATTPDPDYDRKRLDWLVFWTRWALDVCEFPTFYNS